MQEIKVGDKYKGKLNNEIIIITAVKKEQCENYVYYLCSNGKTFYTNLKHFEHMLIDKID